MKISIEKFEIEIEPSLFEGAATLVTMLRKMDVEADAEEGRAHFAVKTAIVGALAPLLTQLLTQVAGAVEKGFPFPDFKPGLHPVDFGHPGVAPTDIQDYIRKRQEAVAAGYAAGLGEPSKQLEPCAECQIDGPHTIHADRRVVRCMWCVAGIHLADRPPVGSLEYMDGPAANPFEPDPAS